MRCAHSACKWGDVIVPKLSSHSGFSLLELMVVVTIASILAAVAIPSFRTFILNSQRSTAVNDLMASLQLARSEATKLGQPVVVCRSNTAGTACDNGTNWSTGWLVFVNTDNDSAVVDSGERILKLGAPMSGSIVITAASAPSGGYFAFRSFGNSSSNGNLRFCDSRGSASAKTIIISNSGRARISDVDSGGSALVCS